MNIDTSNAMGASHGALTVERTNRSCILPGLFSLKRSVQNDQHSILETAILKYLELVKMHIQRHGGAIGQTRTRSLSGVEPRDIVRLLWGYRFDSDIMTRKIIDELADIFMAMSHAHMDLTEFVYKNLVAIFKWCSNKNWRNFVNTLISSARSSIYEIMIASQPCCPNQSQCQNYRNLLRVLASCIVDNVSVHERELVADIVRKSFAVNHEHQYMACFLDGVRPCLTSANIVTVQVEMVFEIFMHSTVKSANRAFLKALCSCRYFKEYRNYVVELYTTEGQIDYTSINNRHPTFRCTEVHDNLTKTETMHYSIFGSLFDIQLQEGGKVCDGMQGLLLSALPFINLEQLFHAPLISFLVEHEHQNHFNKTLDAGNVLGLLVTIVAPFTEWSRMDRYPRTIQPFIETCRFT